MTFTVEFASTMAGMKGPRKMLACISAKHKAPERNRYYMEFFSVIETALDIIEAYSFHYDANDPSINVTMLLFDAATAAGIQYVMTKLQGAFTDIDNTNVAVTTSASAFFAMTAQCYEDDEDDDEDDDDDGESDGENKDYCDEDADEEDDVDDDNYDDDDDDDVDDDDDDYDDDDDDDDDDYDDNDNDIDIEGNGHKNKSVVDGTCRIEWQTRGMPHAHISIS